MEMKSVSRPLKLYSVPGLHLTDLYSNSIDDILNGPLIFVVGDYRDFTADHLHEEVTSNGS
jgi:hypothetical protein